MRRLGRLALIILMLFGLRWWACGPAKDPGPQPDIAQRVWMDKTPQGARDMVLRLVLLRGGHQRAGVVFAASKFRAGGDRLKWKRSGKTLELEILQERQTARFEARSYRCKGPGRFDLCLDLKSGGRKLRLYAQSKARFSAEAFDGFLQGHPPADEASLDEAPEEALPAWFLDRSVPTGD